MDELDSALERGKHAHVGAIQQQHTPVPASTLPPSSTHISQMGKLRKSRVGTQVHHQTSQNASLVSSHRSSTVPFSLAGYSLQRARG